MTEVIWHGRGGQGAFTAARLLGAAASLAEGKHALAFPSFGPERRGAPMRAFTKMSDAPIGDRSAVSRADYVIYLDDTLLGEAWADELKPGGRVLVNSAKSFDDPRILALDADGISSSILGRPIPNTVFLGALAALSDRVALDDVRDAVRQYMPAKLHEKNLAIVDAAAKAVACRLEQAEAAPASEGVRAAPGPERQSPLNPERARRAAEPPADKVLPNRAPHPAQDGGPARKAAAHIPTLRTGALDPYEFAHSTCFEAGYLVAKNAGWRNIRPVIDATACTGCLQCYLYCPDGTVYKVPSGSQPAKRADVAEPLAGIDGDEAQRAPVAIDYDFCKGCGICAKACRFGAIAMVPERETSEEEAR